MPKIIEKPRMQQVELASEYKLPCVVLVDTSISMEGCERELEMYIAKLKETLLQEPETRGRVEIELILFNTDVYEKSTFGLADKLEVPQVVCTGMTSTHAAIDLALRRVEQRKQDYKDALADYCQPWIWLFTDGDYNDPDNGSFDRLLEAQRKGKLTFYPIAIGNAVDEKKLASMHKDGMVMRVAKDKLGEAFVFLSRSLSLRSQRDPEATDTRMQLPDSITAVVYNPL